MSCDSSSKSSDGDDLPSKETVIAVYKGCGGVTPVDIPVEWKVEGLQKVSEFRRIYRYR